MIFGRPAYSSTAYLNHHDENKVTLAFRALDKDGSGTVETAEFKHLMTHVGQYLSLSLFLRPSLYLFLCLCFRELFVLLAHNQPPGDVLTEEEVMMLINAADKDGDGSLDFQEFVKIMM